MTRLQWRRRRVISVTCVMCTCALVFRFFTIFAIDPDLTMDKMEEEAKENDLEHGPDTEVNVSFLERGVKPVVLLLRNIVDEETMEIRFNRFRMDDIIQRYYTTFQQNLRVDCEFCSILMEAGILTDENQEDIMSKITSYRKNAEFLRIISPRGRNALYKTLVALMRTNQHPLADQLAIWLNIPNSGEEGVQNHTTFSDVYSSIESDLTDVINQLDGMLENPKITAENTYPKTYTESSLQYTGQPHGNQPAQYQLSKNEAAAVNLRHQRSHDASQWRTTLPHERETANVLPKSEWEQNNTEHEDAPWSHSTSAKRPFHFNCTTNRNAVYDSRKTSDARHKHVRATSEARFGDLDLLSYQSESTSRNNESEQLSRNEKELKVFGIKKKGFFKSLKNLLGNRKKGNHNKCVDMSTQTDTDVYESTTLTQPRAVPDGDEQNYCVTTTVKRTSGASSFSQLSIQSSFSSFDNMGLDNLSTQSVPVLSRPGRPSVQHSVSFNYNEGHSGTKHPRRSIRRNDSYNYWSSDTSSNDFRRSNNDDVLFFNCEENSGNMPGRWSETDM